MEQKDIITILISGGALAVSLISLYFSLWHKKIALVGCLTAWDSPINGDESYCEITLSNTGNQELLLREVIVDIEGGSEEWAVPVIKTQNIPMVIEPGSIALLTLPIPKLFMRRLTDRDKMMKLEFHLYTSKAELRIASKTLTPFNENNIPKDDWIPFKLSKPNM